MFYPPPTPLRDRATKRKLFLRLPLIVKLCHQGFLVRWFSWLIPYPNLKLHIVHKVLFKIYSQEESVLQTQKGLYIRLKRVC